MFISDKKILYRPVVPNLKNHKSSLELSLSTLIKEIMSHNLFFQKYIYFPLGQTAVVLEVC